VECKLMVKLLKLYDFFFWWYWDLNSAFTLSHSTKPFFVMDFLKIGSQELFAFTDFEL
jgi:hypothetical protein